MYARVLNWQISIGLGLVLGSAAVFLHLKKATSDPAKLRYEEVMAILHLKQEKYQLRFLTPSNNPNLGYIVTRVGDGRSWNDLSNATIYDRPGFVVVVKLAGFALEDPVIHFRFADGEISGDPELIGELVAALKG